MGDFGQTIVTGQHKAAETLRWKGIMTYIGSISRFNFGLSATKDSNRSV
jgi:hypothetical protein